MTRVVVVQLSLPDTLLAEARRCAQRRNVTLDQWLLDAVESRIAEAESLKRLHRDRQNDALAPNEHQTPD